ncbi:hypothetical protein C5167_031828 [Papaver somniferum]|uniref:Uncharacterized protein n=1 Tax=Papaver somniferum TaxID=3469 RepID=A0A4Y7K803_PAPSO|nr:hypothetical protein C5167_031828 [Papaver somniferum]
MVKKQNQQAKKKDEKLKKIAKPSPKGKKRDKEPYRCSLHHLCELAVKIKALIKNKQLHLKALKSSPFWRFFEPFDDGVMNKDELIKKTKAVIMFLSTIENRLDGKLPYCFKLARSRKMILRTIPEHFAVTFGFQMVNYVEADDIDEDLVKKYLSLTNVGKLSQQMVFDMNKVCWPEVFHDYVLDSIMTNRTDVENVVGCVIYPLYWLAEMTKIAQRKHGLDKYPRFARWNLSNICQQVLSNFENLEEKTELWSKENIGHRKGSFLLQYDESEMRLADPVDEVEIVVPDEERKVPIKVQDEENVGASSEANSFKAKYQFARALIEKLRTNTTYVLSKEEESLLAKYDAEDREQQLVITRDVNMINEQESEQEQVISSSSMPVTNDEQEGEGTELTPNTIEDIKVAERVESEKSKASLSMPVTNDEQEGEGTELTPNTVEDIKVAEQVESEMSKDSSSKKIIEQEKNETQFVIDEDVIRKMEYEYNKKGLSQCDSQEKGQRELSAAQRMSNMVTRMREDRRNLVPPIRMQDYNTSVKKRRKVTARKCKENKKVQEVQGVKLKPVDNLKILKVLNKNEKPLVTTFFRKNNER